MGREGGREGGRERGREMLCKSATVELLNDILGRERGDLVGNGFLPVAYEKENVY